MTSNELIIQEIYDLSQNENIEKLKTDIMPSLFQNEDNSVRPHHLIIIAPPGTWLYINDDIVPFVIGENGKFDWDLEDFGTFKELYFSFKDNYEYSSRIFITAFYYKIS